MLAPDLAADVLVESRMLALPPDTGGNRFLSGWWPWRHGGLGGPVVLNPLAAARIEVVQLAARPRTLVLDLLDVPGSRRGAVVVRHAGRVVARGPVADPVELHLPAALPRGRVTLDLAFELPAGDDAPGVVACGVRPAAAGEVRREGQDLVQAGESLVEFVLPVEPGSVLRGRFEPPVEPRPGQRFELTVEDERGTLQKGFRWEGSWLDRLRGERAVGLVLTGRGGFVRVRLAAHGEGPPARWRGLALESRETSSPPRSLSTAEDAARPSAGGRPPRLVVVYVMDALRADAVGHLGGVPGVSPVLDRLAREGLTFRRHRSLAPNTLPSTKSLFVGRAYVTRGGWTLAPDEGTTLAEHFRRAGYRTGLFSGNVHVSRAFGMDRGFEHVAEEVLVGGEEEHARAATPAGARGSAYNDNAEAVHAAALAWLRGLPPGARAFLYLHTIHPHNPYDPPQPIRSRFAPRASPLAGATSTLLAVQHGRWRPSEADWRLIAGLYTGAFAYNDRELGRFLGEAAAFAPPRETLLAVTSDHGEELFDHGGVLHGYTLYEEMLRIPLVLWAPGRIAPGVVDRPTDTLDLRRRLLALLGHTATVGPAPAGPADGPWHHFTAASSLEGGIFSARSVRWKVVLAPRRGIGWGQGEGVGRTRDAEVLFDLARDPRESENRAGRGDLEAAWLRQRLLAWIAAGDGPAAAAPPPPVDEETARRLRALGYAR